MTNDPTKCARCGTPINTVALHSHLDETRKRLIVLEGLQRSASCQRGWLVAAIVFLFAGLVALGWVLI